MNGSVTVHIEAPPEKVFDLVSDVTKIGRYSPETFDAIWLDGAEGPKQGVRFKGHVKRNGKGPIYWTTCTILECDNPTLFSFGVGSSNKPLNVWSYRLEASGGGTDITESFQLAHRWYLQLYWTLFGWARGPTNERGMRATLEKMKEAIEGSSTT